MNLEDPVQGEVSLQLGKTEEVTIEIGSFPRDMQRPAGPVCFAELLNRDGIQERRERPVGSQPLDVLRRSLGYVCAGRLAVWPALQFRCFCLDR
jgi:hypothetical protein